MDERIDASEVSKGLWQGSRPPEGRALLHAGFHALVLCERGYQPGAQGFPGLRLVIGVCLDDDEPRWAEAAAAISAAHAISSAVQGGFKTIVTCAQGLNRSGLVTGLALLRLRPDLDADGAISAIRAARAGALYNPAFVALIRLMGSYWRGSLCTSLYTGLRSIVPDAPPAPARDEAEGATRPG